MKKKLVKTLGIMLSVIAVFSGCGTKGNEIAGNQEAAESETAAANESVDTATEVQQSEQTPETEGITFTDDLGREVTVDYSQRVAAMLGSFVDVWITAGGEVVAAPSDAWTSLDLDLGEDVVNIGSFLEPDVELLIAAEPDFVIASANTDGNLALEETFENAGITVAYFSVSNFSEYLHMLEICTQITGREDLYEKNGLMVQEQIEEVKIRMDGSAPTVLFLRASSTNVKAKGSEGTVGGEILADLGCVNIADSEESLLDDLSMEAIITADPEYIFVTTQGNDTEAALAVVEEQLFGNPAWNSLTAVQEGRYYVLDKSLYNLKPNARWGEAYEKLADILYPVQ